MRSTQREAPGATAQSAKAVALGAADRLCLAAAPTFAMMALLTSVIGDAAHQMLCSGAQASFPLGGMAWMYALMSAFHSAPWLRLIASRMSGARRS